MKTKTKNAIQFVSALILMLAGVVLVFISLFLPPQGEIDASVLAALGEFFTMAGSIWGITSYTRIKIHEIDVRGGHKKLNEEDDEES